MFGVAPVVDFVTVHLHPFTTLEFVVIRAPCRNSVIWSPEGGACAHLCEARLGEGTKLHGVAGGEAVDDGWGLRHHSADDLGHGP